MRKSFFAAQVMLLWVVTAWSQGLDIGAILGYP